MASRLVAHQAGRYRGPRRELGSLQQTRDPESPSGAERPGVTVPRRRVCVQPRPQDGRYQGRRRVPTPPRSRYAAVVTTAIVGAGVVALGASVVAPDAKPAGASYDGDSASLS